MTSASIRTIARPLRQATIESQIAFVDIHLNALENGDERLGIIHVTINPVDTFVTSQSEPADLFLISLGSQSEYEWRLGREHGRIRNRVGLVNMHLSHSPTQWYWHGSQSGVTLRIPNAMRDVVLEEMAMGDPAGVHLVSHMAFDDPTLYHLSVSLLDAARRMDPATQFYEETLGLAFVAHAYRHYSSQSDLLARRGRPEAGLSMQQVERIRAFVRDNPGMPLHLSDIARYMGYTPYYLSRQFRRLTGEGLHDFLMRTRLEYARELLLHTTLGLHEVAQQAGFADADALARHFRRRIGISPREIERPRRLGS
jgi:AraC-like DNA-binding protein